MTEKIWNPLNRPDLGVSNAISALIHVEEWRKPDLLTSVRAGPSLVVASGYGGEHKGARYRSLSILIADHQYLWYWEEQRRRIRAAILRDQRKLSFKNLSDYRKARALVPFLRIANTIPGLLATFLIDTRVKSIFEPTHDPREPAIVDRTTWASGSFEKLMRLAHFGGMLLGGLSAPGQNVLWITDKDEIAPNIIKHREATAVFGGCMAHYITHKMGHFRLATTQSDDGSMGVEDLTSIPDLAAGSLAELASVSAHDGGFARAGLIRPVSKELSSKARAVVAWLAESFHPLRRLTFCIEYVAPDGFKAHLLKLGVDQPIAEYNWVPEFLSHRRGLSSID